MKKKRIHFVSVGGEVMHSLAIVLQHAGHSVTGSDDKLYDPSRTALEKEGLLPDSIGWDPGRIHEGLDIVLVGMHAKKDNPELLRAEALGLPILSYPDFIVKHCQNKQRIVVAGSHGKTTTTAIIMHTLRAAGVAFDYLVGAKVPGFAHMVSLSEESTTMVIEGDEYPSSPLDLTPKFLKYQHHTVVITGVAWDHMNYYPTFHAYKEQFLHLANNTPRGGAIIYNAADKEINSLMKQVKGDVAGMKDLEKIAYKGRKEEIKNGVSYLTHSRDQTTLQIFGKHNMDNIEAARLVVKRIAVEQSDFYQALSSFRGVSRRLSEVHTTNAGGRVYVDYAHAPSKVSASVRAVKKQFPSQPLVVVFEMHTFSSLNSTFTAQYKDSLREADLPIIYIDKKVLASRSQETFSEEMLRQHFNNKAIVYLTNARDIIPYIKTRGYTGANYLFMSSGNFGGLNIEEEARHLP